MLVILCRGIPFCTASVRGELNHRDLRIHTLASCNLPVSRDQAGDLETVLTDGDVEGGRGYLSALAQPADDHDRG